MADRSGLLEALERWNSSAFLIGGLLLVVDAAWLAANIATGAEDYLVVGQLFVGVGWAVALLGLLGVYPSLADRSRWLSRAGAVFAVIGVVTFTVMAAGVLAEITGILPGDFEALGVYFIPGVLVGSVLGFIAFSVASLRTEVYSLSFGILLLAPPFLVLSNILRFILGNTSVMVTLGIVIGDALAMLVIGYYLRNQLSLTARQAVAESTV